MFTLIAENKYGEQLELTHNDAYAISSIDGIDPPDSTINTTHNANQDGSVYNSSYINNRTITITLAINAPAEENRINLYKYFKPKFPVRLYYQNSTRNVYIDGYVQSMPIAFFDRKQTVQIVVYCPLPLFNGTDADIQEFTSVEPLFEFPFEIETNKNLLQNTAESETDSGITFTVNDDGSITVNGTATANAYLVVGAVALKGGVTYALNGCPSGGGATTYRLYWQGVSGNFDQGSGTTYTPTTDTTINIRMVVYNGATVDNLTFYPMVRYASIEDDSYSEYFESGIPFSELIIGLEKSIINHGDIETGVVITIQATGTVTNPKIYNVETGEYMIFNLTLSAGDLLTINTRQGQKSITLLSDGVETNEIGSLKEGSTWFKLLPADNVFTTAADALPENMLVTFNIIDQYEGV